MSDEKNEQEFKTASPKSWGFTQLPTREEARQAARVILMCNGYDLDVWTNDECRDDMDWLRELAQ